MILTYIVKFEKNMTKILPERNNDDFRSENTTKIVMKILQGSAVTQNALGKIIL